MDHRTNFQRLPRILVRDKKVQNSSTQDPVPLQSPTPDAVDAHVWSIWATNTPEAKKLVLQGCTKLYLCAVFGHMGTDIFVQGNPTVPHCISAFRAEIWGHMQPQRLAPDAAMMVLEAKVRPKKFAPASVYRPTATI